MFAFRILNTVDGVVAAVAFTDTFVKVTDDCPAVLSRKSRQLMLRSDDMLLTETSFTVTDAP